MFASWMSTLDYSNKTQSNYQMRGQFSIGCEDIRYWGGAELMNRYNELKKKILFYIFQIIKRPITNKWHHCPHVSSTSMSI